MWTWSSLAPRVALAFVAVALLAAPRPGAAQSQLDTAEAEAFLGSWDLPLQTEYGAFDVDLVITDQSGKLSVVIGSSDLGGTQEVVDVSRSGDHLVLNYDVDAQGQMFPVTMTLSRDGDDLAYSIDAGGGAYSVTGKGTRAAGGSPDGPPLR